MPDLKNKCAVVTGGSRGIGAAVSRALAAAGATVIVAARSQPSIDALVSELGDSARGVICDVADPASIDALAESAGVVDILVNNAGIGFSAPIRALTLEDWNRVMAINATGTFLCTQAFLSGMAERGWGRVVNVASVAATVGGPYIAAYAASKHAVLGFTRSAAYEVARAGVTVNAVCPGYVDTEMTRSSVANIVAKTELDEQLALEKILAANPQQRLLSADEVAAQVVWLCDDASSGVNGQAIVINGGGMLS